MMYNTFQEPLPEIPKGGVRYPKGKSRWEVTSLSDGSEPRYFTSDENLARARREAAGDYDEFPWRTALIFAVILASYSFVLYGCLDTAKQIDAVGVKVSGVARMTSRFAIGLKGSVNAAASRGEEGWTEGLERLLEKSDETVAAVMEFANRTEALKVSLQRQGADLAGSTIDEGLDTYQGAVQDLRLRTNALTAEFEALGLDYMQDARDVVVAVDASLSPLRPHAELLLQWGGPDVVATVDSIAEVRRMMSSMESTTPEALRDLHHFFDLFDDETASLYELANCSGKEFVEQLLSDRFDNHIKAVKQSSQNLATASNSALKSRLVLASNATLEAFRGVVLEGDRQLAKLQMSAGKLGSDGRRSISGIAGMYRVTAIALFVIAVLSAGTCFGYAMYMEYVWENDEVARAWNRPTSKRRFVELYSWAYNLVMSVGETCGFWTFVVILDLVAAVMVLVTLAVSLAGLTLKTVENGCSSTPLLANDQYCTQKLAVLGSEFGVSLLSQDGGSRRTCDEDDVLICAGYSGDLVRMTVCAALLGMVASWCIPRRMIVVRAKAQRSVAAAIAIARYSREPLKLSVYGKDP